MGNKIEHVVETVTPPLSWPIEPGYNFPYKAFKTLQESGLLTLNLPFEYSGKEQLSTFQLLQRLMQVGAVELAAGRLYEGHINALKLISQYASEEQKERYFEEASAGYLFGIWNTNSAKNPVILDENLKIEGAKIYCSGGFCLQRPIITAQREDHTQMLIVHTEDLDKNREDTAQWKPMGMKASRTVDVDFSNYIINEMQLLGGANDYMREPLFSTGAVRFAAVQLGGAQAVAYAAFEHLNKEKRTENPYQQQRMGKITIALESGRNWLKRTGEVLDDPTIAPADKINHANMVRSAILEYCTQILQLAEQSVGLKAMMEDHKMEQLHRDLSTYLKQPGPDQALANVGSWSAAPEHWKDIYR